MRPGEGIRRRTHEISVSEKEAVEEEAPEEKPREHDPRAFRASLEARVSGEIRPRRMEMVREREEEYSASELKGEEEYEEEDGNEEYKSKEKYDEEGGYEEEDEYREDEYEEDEEGEDEEKPAGEDEKKSTDGEIHRFLKPIDERNRRRDTNPFLQKLKNKRGDVSEHMSGDLTQKRGRNIWVYIFGLIILGGFAIYAFFPSVSVGVTPRTESVTLADKAFAASLAAATSTNTNTNETSGQGLTFQLVNTTASAQGEADATGVEDVEQKASGKIVVYNNYSTQDQPIIANTRFQAPNGLIYRAKDAFVIPGMKGSTPGQVTITVYADQAGENYNTTNAGTKFTIPGFEGSPKLFEGFYAKSSTAFTGGEKGTVKKVSDEDLANVKSSLSDQLQKQLLEKARAGLSSDAILFDDAAVVDYKTSVGSGSTADGKAPVTVTGTLTGLIFSKSALAQAIASSTVPGYQGGGVTSQDWSGVKFAFAGQDANQTPDLSSIKNISFTLTGVLPLTWQIDRDRVAESLAGKNTADFKSILKDNSAIHQANSVVRPFWMHHFPEDPMEIKINIENPSASKPAQ